MLKVGNLYGISIKLLPSPPPKKNPPPKQNFRRGDLYYLAQSPFTGLQSPQQFFQLSYFSITSDLHLYVTDPVIVVSPLPCSLLPQTSKISCASCCFTCPRTVLAYFECPCPSFPSRTICPFLQSSVQMFSIYHSSLQLSQSRIPMLDGYVISLKKLLCVIWNV